MTHYFKSTQAKWTDLRESPNENEVQHGDLRLRKKTTIELH